MDDGTHVEPAVDTGPARSAPEQVDVAMLPVWDRAAFDGFTDWMPRHRIEKLLELFRERTMLAIVSLPDEASNEAWERESHDLLYSAGTLGFTRLAEECRRMQRLIRKGREPTDGERNALLDALSGALEVSDISMDPPKP